MDLSISEPRLGKTGKLSGILSVWDGSESIRGWKVGDFAAEKESLTERLTELGVERPEDKLTARVEQTLEALEGQRQRGGRFAPHAWLDSCDWYIGDLAKNGKFLRAGESVFYFNGTGRRPLDLRQKQDLDLLLKSKFPELNPTLQHTRFLAAELVAHAAIQGEDVEMSDTTAYNRETGTLYIDQADGWIAKITKDGVERIRNGHDGVMFRSHPILQPWTYRADHGFPLREYLRLVALRNGGVRGMSRSEQRLALLGWWTFLLFSSDYGERPIALFQGQPGSGKSTAARLVGRVLFGNKFQVNSNFDSNEAQKAFWTSVTSRLYVVIDNFERNQKWTEDALAAVATGTDVSKPVLYQTNVEGLFPVRANIAATAINPKFKRQDVSTRLWFFWFEQLKSKRDEQSWAAWVHKNRDAALSELCDYARWWLGTPELESESSTFRMSGFALWLQRFGEALDRAEAEGLIGPWDDNDSLPSHRRMIDSVISAQQQAQRRFANERHPLLEALEVWAKGSDQDDVPNVTRWVTSSQLVTELNDIATDRGLGVVLTSAVAWTTFLRNNQGLIEASYRLESKRQGGRGRVWRVAPAVQESEEKKG